MPPSAPISIIAAGPIVEEEEYNIIIIYIYIYSLERERAIAAAHITNNSLELPVSVVHTP